MMVFANRLRERAAELGIAHAEAARRAGLTEGRYSHYVNGSREPNLVTLVRIAAVLQTTPDDLLGVSKREEVSARSRLVDRLISAAQGLADGVLEILVIQAEALATSRRTTSSEAEEAASGNSEAIAHRDANGAWHGGIARGEDRPSADVTNP